MATVNINEILGSDSISGSRVTINSNFLTLQNWINGFITVFGVDSVNGIMDLTGASTGRISAKIGRFNTISVPAAGTATASVNSLGQSTFASVTTTALSVSGPVIFAGTVSFQTSAIFVAGATASFNSTLNANAALNLGPAGHITSQNTTYASGLTAGTSFPANSVGGGGVSTTINTPYAITGLEDVIFAECGPTGFYMKVVDGTAPVGGTLPNISAGTRVTIMNTSAATGYIFTGVTGSTPYYTGFNVDASYGGFPSGGLTVSASKSYRSSVILQWEPRVGQGQATQNGSWIVLGATNIAV